QATIFTLVLVVARHFGERLEADRTLLLGLRRFLLAESDGLYDRLFVHLFDGECDLDAFLQLLRLEAVRQVLAALVQHLDALVGLHGALLAIHLDNDGALLGINLLDCASNLEGEQAFGKDEECVAGNEKAKVHNDTSANDATSKHLDDLT